ncbi:MAG: imidazole glycerol phosphate synthase subunit HisH [Salinispira sp.]
MVLVVDYDAGNVRSVETALNYLEADIEISSDPDRLFRADKIIFPGVGQASHAMQALRERGLDQAIAAAHHKGTPILGICIGCHILLEHSAEDNTPCLALEAGSVASLSAELGKLDGEDQRQYKVPHIGWNQVVPEECPIAARLFEDIPQNSSFYFVHSFYPQPDEALILGRTDYGLSFPSVYGREGLAACQFHPEKSGPAGLKLLENFLKYF